MASRWPREHRRDGIGYTVYKALAGVQDEEERFAKLADPPLHERSGTRRWTQDAAKRAMGQRTSRPETVQEKVNRAHDLVEDEEVAVQIASSLLRRPSVVEDVVADDTAMHIVNKAQVNRSKAAAKKRVEPSPTDTPAEAETKKAVKKAAARIAHTTEFVDLIGACAAFTAAAGRIVPTLGEHSSPTPNAPRSTRTWTGSAARPAGSRRPSPPTAPQAPPGTRSPPSSTSAPTPPPAATAPEPAERFCEASAVPGGASSPRSSFAEVLSQP